MSPCFIGLIISYHTVGNENQSCVVLFFGKSLSVKCRDGRGADIQSGNWGIIEAVETDFLYCPGHIEVGKTGVCKGLFPDVGQVIGK